MSHGSISTQAQPSRSPSDDGVAISVAGVGKVYRIWKDPAARLKHPIVQTFGAVLPEPLHPPALKRRLRRDGQNSYYRDFHALREVGFEVRKGESLGIVGKNGSGKSTLLQIIAGTLTPTTGHVGVRGRVAALLELGSGFNPEFTGRENVYLNAGILGLTREETEARFAEIIAFADIGDFLDQPTKIYSSGMTMRLAFAVVAHVDPEILIVDEALAVGDVRFQAKCHRKFEELRAKGITLLLVSHSGDDVLRLCNKVVWLDQGAIRKAGAPKPIMEEYLAHMVHDAPRQTAETSEAKVAAEDNLAPLPADACVTGDGGAALLGVALQDEQGRRLDLLTESRPVQVVYRGVARMRLERPFFAFQVVNLKGLRVTGSNTYVLGREPAPINAGSTFRVSFRFVFPELENGDYLLAVGLNDGTPNEHIRHAFAADAFHFRFLSSRRSQSQAVLLKLSDCAVETAVSS